MSEKQPWILIFNASEGLVAMARSIRSAAELTKVDENDQTLLREPTKPIRAILFPV